MTGQARAGLRRVYAEKRRARVLGLRFLLLLPVCFCGVAGFSLVKPTQRQAPAAVFPPVSSYTLDKQKVVLPQGLAGRQNLLLVSFAPDQRAQVESWTSTAESLQHTNFSFRTYRLPVAESENALFRWWANASLRSAETDPERWQTIVPLYVDKHQFLAQLGITGEKAAVALLIDKSGHVLWRAQGASTPESRAALIAAAGGVR